MGRAVDGVRMEELRSGRIRLSVVGSSETDNRDRLHRAASAYGSYSGLVQHHRLGSGDSTWTSSVILDDAKTEG